MRKLRPCPVFPLSYSNRWLLFAFIGLFICPVFAFGEMIRMRDLKPFAEWVKDTSSPDPIVRLRAIGVLGDFEEKGLSAVPILRRFLTSDDTAEQRGSLYSLVCIYRASFASSSPRKIEEAWAKDLAAGTDMLRAAWALSETATRESATALASALNHDDPCVLYFAMCGLKRIAIDTISGVDNLPREERRRTIIERRTWLARLCMDKLIALAGNRDPFLAGMAIDALGQFGFGTVVGEFGELAGPAMPVFIKALTGDDRELQYHSAVALGTMGPAAKAAVPALIACAEAEERRMSASLSEDMLSGISRGAPRRLSIQALGNIGREARAALPMVIRSLCDKDAEIREAATRALTSIEVVPESIPILIENLADPSWQVRLTSACALAKTGKAGAGAIPALTKLLDDDQNMVRFCAAMALRDLAPYAKSALPTLRKNLDDRDAFVRTITQEAVRAIEAADRLNSLAP